MATERFDVRSAGVNARPRTTAISSTLNILRRDELVGDRCLCVAGFRERRWGARPAASGHDAATAATDGSAVTACTIAVRVDSFTIWTTTVSEVRIPESNVAAVNALLKNTAAEISSSADALTCRPIRTFRARPGRASLTTSPRIVLIGSMRVACSAGASPKNIVETPAPMMRNSSTRQSASGTDNRISPRSGAMLVITAEMIASSATREIAKPAAAATSASSRLSVNSWRTMRRRVAPSDSRMPISRCRATALARSRLATLAQPISRMRPNAKNSGATTDTASRGCGMVPRLGSSVMFEVPRSIGLRVRLARIPDGESRPCRLPRHARLQASDDVEADSRRRFAVPMDRANVTEHRERRPIVVGCDGQSAKFLGHHADDLERDPIDEQVATENGRVARKQPVPSAVTEDHHRLSRGWLVVGRRQRASHRGADARAPGRSCP